MSRYEYRDSRRPPGSHPYYQFGVEKRWPYAWHGGAGGVLPGHRAPGASLGGSPEEFQAAGSADMIESGLDPNWIPYPAFNRTLLHERFSYDGMSSDSPNGGQTRLSSVAGLFQEMGDYEQYRPAGPEPLDPNEATLAGIFDSLSSSEQQLALAAVAGGLVWFFFLRKKKRKNPRRRR